jgi:hypothetical protein
VTVGPDVRALRRARRRRRTGAWRWLGALVLLACVFAGGVAVGEALHDNPRVGGEQTTQRTLRPLALAPQTVTVTVPAKR